MAKKDPKWTDDTPYPWKAYKGVPLKEVPAEHLLWLSKQEWIHKFHGLKLYLEDNAKVLELEAEEERLNDSVAGEPSSSFEDYQRNWRL